MKKVSVVLLINRGVRIIKKSIVLALSIICIVIVIVFVSYKDVFELGIDTYSNLSNSIRLFEENIPNFDSIIEIILNDIEKNKDEYNNQLKTQEIILYIINISNDYTQEQNDAIRKINNYINTDQDDLSHDWLYDGNSIYNQDGCKKYRLVYSIDKKKPHFDKDDYGYWKGTRIKGHWYFFAYVIYDD